MSALVPLEEETPGSLCCLSPPSCTEERSCEDTVRGQPSASRKESSHQNLTLSAPWSRISSLQNCEHISFCCLSPPVCGTLLWQLKLTKTITLRLHIFIFPLLVFVLFYTFYFQRGYKLHNALLLCFALNIQLFLKENLKHKQYCHICPHVYSLVWSSFSL